jgi:non-ribosomal peptide synthase protein (TIGR01720 family)
VSPRTETERALAVIWERVLEVEGVGVDDAFADLGGDSLLSLQILLSIKQAGFPVTPEDIHRHGTIAALAAAIDSRRAVVTGKEGPTVGSVRLTSNQRWLLKSGDVSWAVGEVLLTRRQTGGRVPAGTPPALDPTLLERAAQHLVFHHDALRMRCYQASSGQSLSPAGGSLRPAGGSLKPAGGWKAEYLDHTPPGLVSFLDVSQLPVDEQRARVTEELARVRQSVDVHGGPLFRLGLIRLGGSHDLVALFVHHVIADLVSTEILVRDLDALYAQFSAGESPRLPARSATVAQWSARAAAFARSPAAQQEAIYWRRVVTHAPSAPPLDFPAPGRSAGAEKVVALRLGRELTSELKRVRQTGLSLSNAIHYALARALSDAVGSSTVQFHTLSHARGPLFADLDLSRTVGFLAMPFPLLLELPGQASHDEAVRAVRAQMQAIPHHGVSYSVLLDFADKSVRARLTGPGSESPIQLNYVGESDRPYGELSVFRRATEWEAATGPAGQTSQPVPWRPRIDIAASIEEDDLLLWMTYHQHAYHPSTVERLGRRMLEILTELSPVQMGHA